MAPLGLGVDRPGFPAWSCEQWVEWISDDPDFSAEWTLLADIEGHDVGFVAGAADPIRRDGWIVQVGVVPDSRDRGLGSALVVEAMRRMRAAERSAPTLLISIDPAVGWIRADVDRVLDWVKQLPR